MNKSRGFTLIEILIALAIFAIVATLAYRAVSSMTSTESRLVDEESKWRTLEQVFERVESDVQEALPRQMQNGKSTLPAFYAETKNDGSGLLRFARAPSKLPAAVTASMPPSAGQRVAYEWGKGKLELLYWNAFDTPAKAKPERFTLLDGLKQFQIEYLNDDGKWVKNWNSSDYDTPTLPRALRVRLAAADGEVIERIFVLLM
jgi:general secretion pathway protein J